MIRNTLWLAVNGLMVLSLLIAACGPAATPTTPTAPTTPAATTTPSAPGEAPTQKEAVKALSEKPKYGGTLTIAQTTWVNKFDIAVSPG